MAQSGYTPILIYASGTASNVPLAANMTSSASGAELALNYADGKLYYKNSAGTVTLLASTAGASGDVVGPSSATDNALARFDTTTGKLIQNSVGILSDAGVLTGLTGLTSSGNVTFSALTSGRVPYASTGGLLVDSANLTFDGTNLGVTGSGFANDVGGSQGFFRVTSSNNTANNVIGTFASTSTANNQLNIISAATGVIGLQSHLWSTGATNSLALNPNGGNVGIGTTSPDAKLSIRGGSAGTYADGLTMARSGGNVYGIYANTNDLLFRSVTAGSDVMTLTYGGSLLLGTSSASGAKMDLYFSTTQNGLVIAPTSFVYPTYSLISTNGVIGTVKSGSGTVRLLDIRAQEQTSVANGQVIGGYFQIDNPNAAVNANGGQIGVYGLVNGVNNYTVGHQYGVYGRSGSGGTWGIGVMAVLGADQTIGFRAALLAKTDNTTDRIASFHNSGGEYVQINGLGSVGISLTPNRWFTNRAVLQMGGSVSAISAANGYEIGLNFYVAETTAADKRVQVGYANKIYADAADGDIRFATAGTGAADSNISWSEKMRLTNSGSLLLGNSTACNWQVSSAGHITFTTATAPTDNAGDSYRAGIGWQSGTSGTTVLSAMITAETVATYSANILFLTRNSGGGSFVQRMQLSSTGLLGIGKTPTDKQLEIYAGSTPAIRLQNSTTGTGSNDGLLLEMSGSNINFFNYEAGDMVFGTNSSERARFTSGGNFWFGTSNGSAYFGSAFVVAKNGSDVIGMVNTSGNAGETILSMKGGANGSDSTTTYAVFQRSDGVERGSIRATGATSVVYNTSSDYRLKTVVGPVTDSGSRLDALEPIEFIWNEDGSTDRGFLAHKFKEVYSHSVSGEKDEVDKDGKPKYQSMQASTAEVIADLVSEIQSLRKRLVAAGIA